MQDHLHIVGVYNIECYDSAGNLKWADAIPNDVVNVGKNVMLDAALSGSTYTVTGPFMGLISSVGFSAIDVTDTMSSHAGWTEAGSINSPHYSGSRPTCGWSAASAGAKALSTFLSFNITNTGVIKGCFIVYGSGAVATIDSTAGVLFSAGVFQTGDKPVDDGDVIRAIYSVAL